MFGILENLTKAAVAVVTTPIAMVADVATMGGVLTDRRRSYTGERLSQAADALNRAIEGDE